MKVALFTDDPNIQDPDAWQAQRVVSADEWSRSRRTGADIYPGTKEKFKSREAFLDYLARYEEHKLWLAQWLSGYLEKLGARKILGLCSGECPVEFALKRANPDLTIVATDFDPFVVETMAKFLPELDGVEWCDIKQDDFSRFRGNFDAALMVVSFYMLADAEAQAFFARLAGAGVRHFINLCSSVISLKAALKSKGKQVAARALMALGLYRPRQRFHGWARTPSEFPRLSRPYYRVAELVDLKRECGMTLVRFELTGV